MNIIRISEYIDVSDLPEEAQNAYGDLVSSCGIPNGQHWGWEVGVKGDNCTAEGWITREQCDIIDAALRDAGLKDGEDIDLVSEW